MPNIKFGGFSWWFALFLFVFALERVRRGAIATDPKPARILEVSKSLIMNCLYYLFAKVSSEDLIS